MLSAANIIDTLPGNREGPNLSDWAQSAHHSGHLLYLHMPSRHHGNQSKWQNDSKITKLSIGVFTEYYC